MADDIKEPDLTQPIKRLNYFTGQFLQKEDFLDEQQYHMAMRRHGNRVLYFGKGILDESGFRVNDVGTGKIEVTPGIAIDAEGREIVLVTEIEIDLTPLNLQPNSNYVVTVEYNQQARDEQSTNDNDRSDFTRVLEEPEIKVVSPGPQSAGAIVIANLVTKADGTVEKIEYRDRQRAKARFAGDLTIGQGGNGSLNARHINGKDWRNDTADDLYLNWNSAKNVVLGFGEGTRSSLHVSGNVGIGTMSPRAALEIRGPNSPTGNAGQREIALGFEAAGSARIRAYRGNSWDTTLQFLTNSAATGSDNPAVRLHIGEDGKVGIGTTTPRAKLEVADGAIMPAAGNSDASGILFPLDPGGGGGDKAWIRYFSRYPNDIDPGKKEQMTLEIGVANDNNDHIALISSGGVGIGTMTPDKYRLMIAGGDTRIAALGQEQSLYGLDKLVGFNDLRFYVDDTGNAEIMRLDDKGLTLMMPNPTHSVGFRNTLTRKNIIKAWAIVAPSGQPGTQTVHDGFNVSSVQIDGSSFITVRLTEALTSYGFVIGNVHSYQDPGAILNLAFENNDFSKLTGRGRYLTNLSSSSTNVISWASGAQMWFSFLVIGSQ